MSRLGDIGIDIGVGIVQNDRLVSNSSCHSRRICEFEKQSLRMLWRWTTCTTNLNRLSSLARLLSNNFVAQLLRLEAPLHDKRHTIVLDSRLRYHTDFMSLRWRWGLWTTIVCRHARIGRGNTKNFVLSCDEWRLSYRKLWHHQRHRDACTRSEFVVAWIIYKRPLSRED